MVERPRSTGRSTRQSASRAAAPPPVADLSAPGGESATLPDKLPSRLEGRTGGTEEARQRSLDDQCANFQLTDLGNVDRFAARNAERFLYNSETGWLRRAGECWRPANKEHLLIATHECVRAIQFEAAYVAESGRDYVVRVQYRGSKGQRAVFRSDELRSWGRSCEQLRKLAGIQPHIAAKMNVDDLSKITLDRAGSGPVGSRVIRPAAVAVHCFLKECTRPSLSRRIQARALYEAYSVWSKENDQPECTATMFGRLMKEIGFDSYHSNFNWWIGFELISRAATGNGSEVDNHEYREANSRESGCLQ